MFGEVEGEGMAVERGVVVWRGGVVDMEDMLICVMLPRWPPTTETASAIGKEKWEFQK